MDPGQLEALLRALYEATIAPARDSSAGGTETVTPGEYIHGWGATQNPTLENPEANPVNSGWYDLVAPPTCQGSLALEGQEKNQWFCSGCLTPITGKWETERHIKTAGMEVRCRYCDKVINGALSVLERHLESGSCKRGWAKRGFTGERTVDGAFRA